MSSSKSESDIIRDFESDFGSNVDFESTHQDTENDSDESIAYADEPLANEEWSIEYNTQNKVREELEIELKPSQRGQS